MLDADQFREFMDAINSRRAAEKGNVIERHAQTIMVGLVTIGIVWMSSSISNTNADVKVLKIQNENMSKQLTDLTDLVQSERGLFVPRAVFDQHERDNERRISRLEQHVRIDEQGWQNR